MNYRFRSLLIAVVLCGVCGWASSQPASPASTIRQVSVLPANNNGVELEIVGTSRLTADAQLVTGPDRLVIDLPNAVPADTLRNFTLNRGEVKAVRVARFSENPPTTRVVVDLKTPQQYQVFPSGNTVIVKVGTVGAALKTTSTATLKSTSAKIKRAPIKNAGFNTEFEVVEMPTITPPPAPPRVQVTFVRGNLTILANKATLSEVLYEVQRKTGADIAIPAGSEREQVSANFGPGPARDILASLLNGSNFNFIMIAEDNDPSKLRSVLLSPKGAPMVQPQAVSPAPNPPNASVPPNPGNQPNVEVQPPAAAQPEIVEQPDQPNTP